MAVREMQDGIIAKIMAAYEQQRVVYQVERCRETYEGMLRQVA